MRYYSDPYEIFEKELNHLNQALDHGLIEPEDYEEYLHQLKYDLHLSTLDDPEECC